jgi:uncharacterized protein YkwD
VAPLVACLTLACRGAPLNKPPVEARSVQTASAASDGGELFTFPEQTASPLPTGPTSVALAELYGHCRKGDGALARVAERFARRQNQGNAALDVSEINFALRAEGSPYVWPRAWTLEGVDLTGAAAAARMQSWLGGFDDGGERRCGLAIVGEGEQAVLAAVAIDALADLEPLAVRERAGSWVELDARMLVATNTAKYVVLGPTGTPYGIPTSFDGQRARARFHADRPGAFLVQLLADVAGGPRPVLEATVYADVEPPSSFNGERAPGEPRELATPTDDAEALVEMLNAARATENSPALTRHPALDAIAQRHAEAMRRLKRVAHDAGDGNPRSRVNTALPSALATGENVAHALDIRRAHRALWASPSHRENLLQPRFDTVGIGVAVDPDGSIWVCEVFADLPDADPERR